MVSFENRRAQRSIIIIERDYMTKQEARQEVIDWQAKNANRNISFEELFIAQDYFIKLGEKFNLLEEFKENGII